MQHKRKFPLNSHTLVALHNNMASTFVVRQCSKQLNPSFPHAPSLFLCNGYNLLFRAFCFTHFYSLIFAPSKARFCMTRNFLAQKTNNNNNCNFRKEKNNNVALLRRLELPWYTLKTSHDICIAK